MSFLGGIVCWIRTEEILPDFVVIIIVGGVGTRGFEMRRIHDLRIVGRCALISDS